MINQEIQFFTAATIVSDTLMEKDNDNDESMFGEKVNPELFY